MSKFRRSNTEFVKVYFDDDNIIVFRRDYIQTICEYNDTNNGRKRCRIRLTNGADYYFDGTLEKLKYHMSSWDYD